MSTFSWHIPTRILFGQGTLGRLAAEVGTLGARRVLIMTDPIMAKLGLAEQVRVALPTDVERTVYADVVPEPPMESLDAVVRMVRAGGYDLIIGFGGGSSLDSAKLAAVLATNSAPMLEYVGTNLVPAPGLPTILIPTTAGTGSEVTPIAIITDGALKKGIVSPYLYATVAICDPTLSVTMPPAVTAATGMDALTHAVEAYVSVNASPISDVLALEAVRVIARSLRRAFANGGDLVAREQMLYGSMLAGKAFTNAGVGAVHALAYPLGGEFHVPHGVANALLLSAVMGFNLVGCVDRLGEVARAMGEPVDGLAPRAAAEAAIAAMQRLSLDVEIPQTLRAVGVPESALPGLAAGAAKVTRLLANNPRRATEAQILEIYRRVL